MYCPKCGTAIEGVKFCRQCGTNVSLVSRILTGELTEETQMAVQSSRPRRKTSPPQINDFGMSKGIENAFTGIAFFLVALSVLYFGPAGRIWWFWLLIPAFVMLGGGVAAIFRARYAQKMALQQGPQNLTQSAFPQNSPPPALSSSVSQPYATGKVQTSHSAESEIPGSVAEGTTRQLQQKPQS
jgi:hypothetical protein